MLVWRNLRYSSGWLSRSVGREPNLRLLVTVLAITDTSDIKRTSQNEATVSTLCFGRHAQHVFLHPNVTVPTHRPNHCLSMKSEETQYRERFFVQADNVWNDNRLSFVCSSVVFVSAIFLCAVFVSPFRLTDRLSLLPLFFGGSHTAPAILIH